MVWEANWIEERKTITKTVPAHWGYSWHTLSCHKHTKEMVERYVDWAKRWPYHCDTCGAVGILQWFENGSPHDSGEYWPMPMQDICDDCIGHYEMACPRCGEAIYHAILDKYWDEDVFADQEEVIDWWDRGGEPCPICGWSWGKGADDYAPPRPDGPCGCYEYEDWEYVTGKPPMLGKWQKWCFEKLGLWTQRFFNDPIVKGGWGGSSI